MEDHLQVQLEQPKMMNVRPLGQSMSNSYANSEYLSEYLNFMNMSNVKQMKMHRKEVLRVLQEEGLVYNENLSQSLKFKIIEFTNNYEYILLQVSYNNFLFNISIINIDEESPMHKILYHFNHKYYPITHMGKNIAVKCCKYNRNIFLSIFKRTLLQYLTLEMVARLKSGPKMPKIFGFDLLVYKNCIEFSMEFVEPKMQQIVQKDLKLALKNLHSLKIIHHDIRPQHIGYSQQENKYIFLGFNFHKDIKEEIGQKSFTEFRGSLIYCNQEMLQCFHKGSAMVDLYYNDILCLTKSLKQLHEYGFNEQNIIFKQKPRLFEQPIAVMFMKIKYTLTQINKYATNDQFLADNLFEPCKKLGLTSLCIQDFIPHLHYSLNLQKVINQLVNENHITRDALIVMSKFKNQFRKNKNCEEVQIENFEHFAKALLKQSIILSNDFITWFMNCSLQECIDSLSDAQKISRWDLKLHYLLFSEMTQVNSWKINAEERERICNAFNKMCFGIPQFEKLTLEQKTKLCFIHICEFIKTQATINSTVYKIINNSLVSAILLQIYSEEQLRDFIFKLISSECPLKTQIRLFIFILSCLQWIPQIYTSIYCYYYLKDQVYNKMISKINKIKVSFQEKQVFFVDIITTFLGFSKESESNSTIPKILSHLKQILDGKITKYFNAFNQSDQILAEIYVYFLVHSSLASPNLQTIAELLQLYSYQKEKKPYISHYYQFAIVSFSMPDKILKSGAYGKFKQLSPHFRCFQSILYQKIMDTRQLYYQKESIIYFHKIDFSKFNKLSALYYREHILRFFLNLSQLDSHNSLDMPSMLENLRLEQINQFLPMLEWISISDSAHKHGHEFIGLFKIIWSTMMNYHQLSKPQIELDMYDDLQNIVSQLSCLKCKIKCILLYMMNSFGQFEPFKIYKERQLFSLIVWLIKQKQFVDELLIIFETLSFSSKEYLFQKLYIEYLMHNDIELKFIPDTLNMASLRNRAKLLSILWRDRFLDKNGQSLYILFIIKLCRQLTQNKLNNSLKMQYFAQIIWYFIKSQRFTTGFFEFNYRYLLQHRQRLKKQPSCALYFGIILNSSNRDEISFIQSQYYYFIWQQIHKLNAKSKELINNCIYQSFADNEFQSKPLSHRRCYHLLKLEYKSTTAKTAHTLNFIEEYVDEDVAKFRNSLGLSHQLCKLITRNVQNYYSTNNNLSEAQKEDNTALRYYLQ